MPRVFQRRKLSHSGVETFVEVEMMIPLYGFRLGMWVEAVVAYFKEFAWK